MQAFLAYIPDGPLDIAVDYENYRGEGRRLANAVIEMLKKNEDEVRKMGVKK